MVTLSELILQWRRMSAKRNRWLRLVSRAVYFVAALGCFVGLGAPCIEAQTVSVIHAFGQGCDISGVSPQASLLNGKDGYLYGTTLQSGAACPNPHNYYGTIFRVKPDGSDFFVLASFNGASSAGPSNPAGRAPTARLTLGHDGYIYGTTGNGGITDNGTIFRFDPRPLLLPNSTATVQTIATFTGTAVEPQGSQPNTLMQRNGDNAFYGTSGSGTIFKMTMDPVTGNLQSCMSYVGLGTTEATPLDIGDGNLYFTLEYSEDLQYIPATWVQKPDPKFDINNHSIFPASRFRGHPKGLILGKNGMIYGVSQGAEVQIGQPNPPVPNGTVFQIDPSTWVATPIATFNGANGDSPVSGGQPPGLGGNHVSENLLQANDGNLYGTTMGGSSYATDRANANATLFQVVPPENPQSQAAAKTRFTFRDPTDPNTPKDSLGNQMLFFGPYDALIEVDDPTDLTHLDLFGTASFGGDNWMMPGETVQGHAGVVYRLQMATPCPCLGSGSSPGNGGLSTGPSIAPCLGKVVTVVPGFFGVYRVVVAYYPGLLNCYHFIPQQYGMGDPFEVAIQTLYLPPDWANLAQLKSAGALFGSPNTNSTTPVFLLPELQSRLKAADLQIKLQSEGGMAKVKQLHSSNRGATFLISGFTDKGVSLDLSGKLPKNAKEGDAYLIIMTAHYKKMADLHSGDTRFTELLEVGRTLGQK